MNSLKHKPGREAAVSPVIGTVLLIAMIATALAIISVTAVEFTYDSADKEPDVLFEASADKNTIYHAGGAMLDKSDLVFYDTNGTDISGSVLLMNPEGTETMLWKTGGMAVSETPIAFIVGKTSEGESVLLYQRGEYHVLSTGNMVPDVFEIFPAKEEETKANVTIGNLYEVWDYINQREVVVTINVTLDGANTSNLTKVNITAEPPEGKTYASTVLSIDTANLTPESGEPLPRQIVYDDPKNTTLTFGVFFDWEQSLPEASYTIPGIAEEMYKDIVFTVYGTYTDNRTDILYKTDPVTFTNIKDAYDPPTYEDIVFATETKNTKYVMGSVAMNQYPDECYDSPLFLKKGESLEALNQSGFSLPKTG